MTPIDITLCIPVPDKPCPMADKCLRRSKPDPRVLLQSYGYFEPGEGCEYFYPYRNGDHQ